MRTTSADLAAPHWLVQLLRSTPAAPPWTRAVRAAIALATPLAVAYALGDIGLGALISTGALPTVLAESAGPYGYRARRLLGAVTAGAVGYAVGLLTGFSPVVSVPAVVLVAGVSALISAAGNNASIAALQMFVFTTLGTGQHAVGAKAEVAFGCFVAGALWGVLVALIGWTLRATTPERTAVAQVYIELAAMLSATDEPTARVARHQLTTAMNVAYDRLLTARSWISGRDATYRKLLNRLAAGTPAVEAAVAMVNAGQRGPREAVDYLSAVATAVHAGTRIPPPPETSDREPSEVALYAGLANIGKEEQRERRRPASPSAKMAAWARALVSGPLTWIATLRLTLCVAIAEVVSLLVPFERSYWIALTVGIVLKPDFGSVFGRAVLRGIGTVVGVGIGAVALGFGASGWLLVVLIAVLAGGAAIGKVRNYAILSAFITPLIILQMDLANQGDWSVALARLVDTVLGCLIVLVFGYLLWPGSMRPRVGGRLAEVLDTVGGYTERALTPATTAEQRTERSRHRRRAYRALADLRTAFQQVIVEPSAAGRQATAWWPAIVGLEGVVDAVTEVVVTVRHGADPPEPADVRLLGEALSELAAAVRDQRAPGEVVLPDTEQLAGVVDHVNATFDAVGGPDVSGSSPMRALRRVLPRRRAGGAHSDG